MVLQFQIDFLQNDYKRKVKTLVVDAVILLIYTLRLASFTTAHTPKKLKKKERKNLPHVQSIKPGSLKQPYTTNLKKENL